MIEDRHNAMTTPFARPRRGPSAGLSSRAEARSATGAAIAASAIVAVTGALWFAIPSVARAHDLRPALFSMVQTAAGPGAQDQTNGQEFTVDFRMPVDRAAPGRAPTPVLPDDCQRIGETSHRRSGDSAVTQFRVRVPGGLAGRRIGFHFPRAGDDNEVLIRVATSDGRTRTARLVAQRGGGDAFWSVPLVPTPWNVAGTYFALGVEHILTGLDHLAFVLGLVLLTPAFRRLWKTVTAFTAAHSVTLALASLGIVQVPQPPVEAAIALSIVFVAREAWRQEDGFVGLTARRPWAIAFAFGLLHGLGFAGALAEVGLPQSDIPLALLTFNLGVELGQVLFVVALLLVGRALARQPIAQRPLVRLAPAYVIGSLASFWCLQRVVAFWG